MPPLGDMRSHYWLLLDMARKTDVDLVAAFRDGRITNADWAGMVAACRACNWTEGCREWMRDTDQCAVAPARCRNRARLAVLRADQEMEAT